MKQNINYGTLPNDGTGESWRSAFKKTKENFDDLYSENVYKLGELMQESAITANDEDDLYAHDSMLLIVSQGVKRYALIGYQCDKVTKNEYAATMHARIAVINLQNKQVLSSIELAKGNTTYNGITLANSAVAKPRLHDIGSGVVRCYFSNGNNIYYRDLTLSTLTLGNVVVFQATIRNAANNGWDASPVDLTVTNLNTHCFRTTGKNLPDPGAFSIMAHISGIDHVQQVGSNYYMSCEAYYANSGDYGVAFLMESSDKINWRIYPPVMVGDAYTDCKTSESSFQYINNRWNIISRANNYLYAYSTDGGLTWSSQVASGLINPNYGSKTSADYVNIQKGASTFEPTSFFAYNKDSTIYGIGRPTLSLAKTSDMVNFVDLAILENYRTNHYPALCYYNGFLYMIYTTSRALNTDRDTLMFTRFNPHALMRI